MKVSHHGVEAELCDSWWSEARMMGFTPSTKSFRVALGRFTAQEVFEVHIPDIGPVVRAPGVGIFNNNAEATAQERVVRILRAIRSDTALPALPCADGAFDVVVMQHVAMQIAEKDQLFGECVRVLKPGGVLALHEIFAGEGGPPHFPLAWATEPSMSSLETFAACAARLAHLGMQVGPFVDQSEAGRQHHEANIQALRQAIAHQEGAQGRSVAANTVRLQTATAMERNLREGRLQVGMIVCRKTLH